MKRLNCSLLAILAYSSLISCHAVVSSGRSSARAELPLVYEDGVVNLDSLHDKLSNCEVVKELSHIISHEHHDDKDESSGSYIDYLFANLFPFGPAGNALLATAYISGPPNFILAMIPASIDVSSLSLLVSFAIGGLLGDVFLHLLPQTFLGEPLSKDSATFVLVDEKRNCILGLFIFVGFLMFFIIDKSLRILEHTGDNDGNSHGHSHSHAHSTATSSAIESKDDSNLKKRSGSKKSAQNDQEAEDEPVISNPNSSIKTSAYLNLISDFTHNITDGLAIAASFYISKSVGCTTTLAVFFHEIPHEVGDFALLIQGGFTKWQAMNSQFITAIGAFLGTFIGIAIQNIGSSTGAAIEESTLNNALSPGLWGTTVEIGDLTLPFTAGGFLYIATVGVIPEVLELSKGTTRFQEFTKGLMQIFFVLFGIFLMFCIAWFE